MVPRWASVLSLYALQKSMMATPCGPSGVPTGGAGVAPPAGIWILTTAATFFLAIVLDSVLRGFDVSAQPEGRAADRKVWSLGVRFGNSRPDGAAVGGR